MNHLLMAAGAILFSVGVLQKPKNSDKLKSNAKSMPVMPKAEKVKNEQTSNINSIDSTDSSGNDNLADMGELPKQE
tara:strand:- start:4961 stop:5188 length:228 start_codon:yes stop_codon:yes gene_type:complete